MSSFSLHIFSVAVLVMINVGFSDIISIPTSGNSSHQYYINSEYHITTKFQFDTINCGGSYCHIICDETAGCFGLEVNALSADILIIECLTDTACKRMEINGPKTYLNVYCGEKESCSTAIINVQNKTNVNLKCNYSTSCYNLNLNAKNALYVDIQCLNGYSCNNADYYLNYAHSVDIACSDGYSCNNADYYLNYAHSVDIACSDGYSCNNADYYLNYAHSVTVKADGSYTMQHSNLYAYNMNSSLNITCSESHSCNNMNIYADYMTAPVLLTCSGSYSCQYAILRATNMESSMTVNCHGSYGCSQANFYCPISKECNIDCDAADSCYNTQFYVPDRDYTGFNLQCSSTYSDSCYSADIRCSDTTTTSTLVWDSLLSDFKCNTYGCCTFSEGNIACSSGVPCLINCNTENCRNHIIDGTLANTLTIDCTGSSCDGSTILCPTSDSTSCSINCAGNTCQYASISTGSGNTMNNFILNCGYSNGCQYVSVSLNATSITDVSINCSSTYSCRYTSFNIASTITNSLNLSCSSSGCYDIDVHILSSFINKLLWECTESQSCYSASMTSEANSIINWYQLSCIGSESCRSIHIDANIAKSVHFNCGGSYSCQYSNIIINVTANTSDVSFIINCVNAIPSTSHYYGACYKSYWYLYGYIDLNGEKQNNMALTCSQYDCHSATFYSFDLHNAQIICHAPYSCQSAEIRRQTTDKLYSNSTSTANISLHCGSTSSCYDISFIIASSFINKLLWECIESSSCNSATMNIGQSSVVNWYELLCIASRACYAIDIDANIGKSANIDCVSSEACENSNINLVAITSDVNFTVDCVNAIPSTSYSYGSCYNSHWYLYGYIDPNGDKQNIMTLTCSQYDCHSADLYGYDLHDVQINCDAPNSCQSVQLKTGTSDKLDLNCNNDYACKASSVYCPYLEEKSCKITCSTQTQTCNGMQIHVPGSYVYNYLDLFCASKEIYPTSNACVGLDVNCDSGNKLQAAYVYNYTIHDYECQHSGALYCCPSGETNTKTCESEANCTIDCTANNGDCQSAVINGTDATYLNLNCGAAGCQDTTIYCPNGGCLINCTGTQACVSAIIIYNGQLSDNAVLSVRCDGNYACDGATINAHYINEFDITCTGSSGYQYQTCDLILNANYANKVFIDVTEYAGYSSTWNVQSARFVSLNAFGHYAMYQAKLYANYAESVMLSFSSQSGNFATRLSDYYVSRNTTISCYGTGCFYLDDIYRGSNDNATGLQFNVETCGECTDIKGCIDNFQINCDNGWDYFSGGSGSGCDNYNNCGCRDVIDNARFALISPGNKCYSTPTGTACKSGEDCVINCDHSYGSCNNVFIDGSLAMHLTVNCGYSDYCKYVMILCPIGGCIINCDGYDICYKAQIYYSGTELTQSLNQNGNVSVTCTDEQACDSVLIHASYAKVVTLYATDSESFYRSKLYAEYAESVIMTFVSTYATRLSDYYVPQNTIINCYGKSCFYLDDIYRGSNNNATGLQLNVESCGQCGGITDCIYDFQIYCDSGAATFKGGSSPIECDSDKCGCKDVINNAKYSAISSGHLCQSILNLKTCRSGDCVINCDQSYGSCYSTWIDGSAATYLTVNCGFSSYCNNALIICPVGGCAIDCNGGSVCFNVYIYYSGTEETQNLNQNGNISLICAENSCNTAELYASYADKVNLNFTGFRASYGSVFHVNAASSVELFVSGEYAFYSSTLYADDAESVIMTFASGSNEYATRQSKYYVPQNTIINCYGTGCQYLNDIYRGSNNDATGLQLNVESCNECKGITDCIYEFDIYCDSGTDSFRRKCDSDNKCGCNEAIDNATYSIISPGSKCSSVLNSKICTSGEDCMINCSQLHDNCTDTFIDGSLATHLTVNCEDINYCQYSLMICPIGGCIIKCNGYHVCYKAQIYYSGTELTQSLNQNGNVSVICTADDACNNMEIYATYANDINIECNQASYTNADGVCQYVQLYAEHTNKANLNFNGYRASRSSTWNVDNASSVILNAGGASAFFSSSLRAESAGSVEISCGANDACLNSNYYTPYDTIFNCYGKACYDLGNVRFSNTSMGLQINAFGCNECSSFISCVGTFVIYCPYSGSSQVRCNPSSSYTFNDHCGCNDLRSHRMKYMNSTIDGKCYLGATLSPTNTPTALPTTSNTTVTMSTFTTAAMPSGTTTTTTKTTTSSTSDSSTSIIATSIDVGYTTGSTLKTNICSDNALICPDGTIITQYYSNKTKSCQWPNKCDGESIVIDGYKDDKEDRDQLILILSFVVGLLVLLCLCGIGLFYVCGSKGKRNVRFKSLQRNNEDINFDEQDINHNIIVDNESNPVTALSTTNRL